MAVFITGAGVVPSFSSEINITADNIENYFAVTNNSYYFEGNGSVFTTNNGGKSSSDAKTTLTALFDMDIFFYYSYSSEQSFDKFTLKVAGIMVENEVSGVTQHKSYAGKLTAGQSVEFRYSKDNSQDSNDDKCTFSYMTITGEF